METDRHDSSHRMDAEPSAHADGRLCRWCGVRFPAGELRQEADLGPLCGRCIAAIRSRGEILSLMD